MKRTSAADRGRGAISGRGSSGRRFGASKLALVGLLTATTLFLAPHALAADVLASCTRAAPLPTPKVGTGSGGFHAQAGMTGDTWYCDERFALVQPQRITLRLTPGPDFSGRLTAYTSSGSVTGLFAAGQLVDGAASATFQAPAGSDHLVLKTAGSVMASAGGTVYVPPCWYPYIPPYFCHYIGVPLPVVGASFGPLGGTGQIGAEVIAAGGQGEDQRATG